MLKMILVTGKNGQLGKSMKKIAGNYPQFDFTFVGREELDLASNKSIADFFEGKHFDAIINCAAYTAVDKAQSEPELADQVNHLAVKQLAEIAKHNNSTLIHISTDYVFDGTNHKPYTETDKTNPINVYGITKLKGEQAIQAINPKGLIIRTSWVYSEFGNNFVKTMLRIGEECDSLNVIYDQIGSPTYATDLANAILAVLSSPPLIERDKGEGGNSIMQIYHYSNEGVCTWYDFAQAIFDIANTQCQVKPIETKNYPTPARRPLYCLMNKSKIKKQITLTATHWRISLKELIMEILK